MKARISQSILVLKNLTAFLPLMLLSIFLVSCQANVSGVLGSHSSDQNSNNGDNGDNNSGGDTQDPNEANAGLIGPGAKDYRGLEATLTAVTGIPRTKYSAIKDYIDQNESSLPMSKYLSALSSTQILATFNLATKYCEFIVDRSDERERFFKGSSFENLPPPNQSLSNDTQKLKLIDFYLGQFWGPGVLATQKQQAETDMMALLNQTLEGQDLNSSNTTKTVLYAACSGILGSGGTALD